jgi:hypothetical protein
MKKTFLTLALAVMGLAVMAQGQPHAKIFSNFNYDLSEGGNEFKAFEVSRAYLGYGHKIDDNFSAKVTFDVGNNDAGSAYTAFLKVAALTWKANDQLTVNFGQVSTKNFKFMEKVWGHRYVYKMMLDKQKWASSADVGFTADYKLNNKMSFDLSILNGEGYKKEQSADGLFRGGLGLTFKATDNISLRAYRDVVPRNTYGAEDEDQHTTTAAMSYKRDGFVLGAEYSIQENANNVLDQNRTGMSLYGIYNLTDDLSFFGRYDEMASEDDWNISKDGSLMIVGLERVMAKGVKAALNYQAWTDAAEGSEAEGKIYLNLEYKF